MNSENSSTTQIIIVSISFRKKEMNKKTFSVEEPSYRALNYYYYTIDIVFLAMLPQKIAFESL